MSSVFKKQTKIYANKCAKSGVTIFARLAKYWFSIEYNFAALHVLITRFTRSPQSEHRS